MRSTRTGLAIASIAVIAAAGVPAIAQQALSWTPCPEEFGRKVECAEVSVPRDYDDPAGPQIKVAISRQKATSDRRRGILLLNPGGPGSSGRGMPGAVGKLAPRGVTDQYDLIGFDPRGTGASTPVSCELTAEQQDVTKLMPYPAPDGSITANLAYAEQVAGQCAADPNLPHVTTANTARDMDRIRAALGEEKISYFGGSYGSYLGAVFTTLFPERSDRVVLDAVVDPTDVWRRVWQFWGPANEERFDDFARWAAQRHPTYELGNTPQAVRQTYLDLTGKLDITPLAATRKPMSGNDFRGRTRGALYGDESFPSLAKLWQAAKLADAAKAAEARDELQLPDDSQSLPATLWGIACNEASWPRDPEVYRQDVARDRKRYPITGGMPSNVWPCAFWPHQPETPVAVSDRGQPTVLLLQNRRDPATPLPGAVAMRDALGDRARLVLADQGGHGTYLTTQNACASNAATAYLVHGTVPEDDVTCGPDTEVPDARVASGPKRDELVRKLRAAQFPF
ncbi:alpha/beta hydrolase [Amycolatopsis magusensis]|uniref:Pimeloyl-ACP methyl ester carboxylesterase n=1 Tax=Amycolatopsis magusensis TaxID=882444 RepID=A0ABS4Q3R5_9PSEU|nr:alpha/beta hydrolase [Amycolatopsis magusensis]MBP2186316.1 pimeloyl-ACP methyl ester carboxylesterase [Amycolatopsis magusensis]